MFSTFNYKLVAALILFNLEAKAHFPDVIELSDIGDEYGSVINGSNTGDLSGFALSEGGDVNGDGIDDLIIAAPGFSDYGVCYVVFGTASGFPQSSFLSTIDGTNGFKVRGITFLDFTGNSVSTAGDINNDGMDDIIIGAAGTDNSGNASGSAYVIFGSTEAFDSTLSVSDLDGVNGFTINGAAELDTFGYSVSNAGDFNNDGFDDVIIGARDADPNGNNKAGAAYVVFGKSSFDSVINVANLNGVNGVAINGINAFDTTGFDVSNAGDLNHDGYDDVIVGAPFMRNTNPTSGAAFVVFGGDNIQSPFNLFAINGSNGVALFGSEAGETIGYTNSDAGDVNGDGIDDIIVSGRANSNTGSAFVIYGKDVNFPFAITLSSLNGVNGSILTGISTTFDSSASVGYGGDLNSDGLSDLLIGSPASDPNNLTDAGITYVVYGQSGGIPSPMNLSDLNGSNGFALQGINSNDLSGSEVSNAGDLDADGIGDIVIGAYRADPNFQTSAGSSYVIYGKPNIIFADGFESQAPDM